MATCGYPYVAMSPATRDTRPLARLFAALSDETRLRIVALLAHGELCVCHVQEALELSQPNVSRQLASLRAAGLVEDRREGSWVYYRLLPQADPDCERVLGELVRGFAKDGAVRRDVAKVVKTCGPGASR